MIYAPAEAERNTSIVDCNKSAKKAYKQENVFMEHGMKHDFEKCFAVVKSCKTLPQMITAVEMSTLFIAKWSGKRIKTTEETLLYYHDLLLAQKKRIHVLKEYGQTLEGADCLVVSNEDIPVWKGRVDYFDDFGNPEQLPLPIISSVDEGYQPYLVMGIVFPFNEGTQIMLNEMPYKERWNLVCRPHSEIE